MNWENHSWIHELIEVLRSIFLLEWKCQAVFYFDKSCFTLIEFFAFPTGESGLDVDHRSFWRNTMMKNYSFTIFCNKWEKKICKHWIVDIFGRNATLPQTDICMSRSRPYPWSPSFELGSLHGVCLEHGCPQLFSRGGKKRK